MSLEYYLVKLNGKFEALLLTFNLSLLVPSANKTVHIHKNNRKTLQTQNE
jgi:hypothetical protein